jgi:hypothetical protein
LQKYIRFDGSHLEGFDPKRGLDKISAKARFSRICRCGAGALAREGLGKGTTSQFAEKVSLRIRVCLQAYRKLLKMRPALAAEVAVNRREMTFSASCSVVPNKQEKDSGTAMATRTAQTWNLSGTVHQRFGRARLQSCRKQHK